MSGVGSAATHQIDAHEVVAYRKVARETLQQGGFPKSGPRGTQENDASISPVSEVQNALQALERLLVDFTKKIGGLPAKNLKPGAERISETHDKAEKSELLLKS
jgi:hypothetical protein